jgi:hypothetical protein
MDLDQKVSVDAVVQARAPAFTVPPCHTHCQLLLGWVLCLGNHRLGRVADTAPPQALRDHTQRHGLDTPDNFFERAAGAVTGRAYRVALLSLTRRNRTGTATLLVDDTLAHQRGQHSLAIRLIVLPSMMPSGVEHKAARSSSLRRARVLPSMVLPVQHRRQFRPVLWESPRRASARAWRAPVCPRIGLLVQAAVPATGIPRVSPSAASPASSFTLLDSHRACSKLVANSHIRGGIGFSLMAPSPAA